MLRTNSKKAVENIRAYIIKHFDGENYNFSGDANDFHEVAAFIYKCFIDEKYKGAEGYYARRGYSMQNIFAEWAAGIFARLPFCFLLKSKLIFFTLTTKTSPGNNGRRL